MRQTLQQSYCRVDDARISRSDVNSAPLLDGWQAIWKHLQNQIGDLARIEIDDERKIGLGAARLRDLRSDRQSHGEDDHARRVVFVSFFPDDDALCTLG